MLEMVSLALIAFMLSTSGGGPVGAAAAILLLMIAIAVVGFLAAVVACLRKPRDPYAVAWVALHLLPAIGIASVHSCENSAERRWEEEWRREEEELRRQSLELSQLVAKQQWPEARRLLRKGRFSYADVPPTLLCPKGGAAPDRAMVCLLAELPNIGIDKMVQEAAVCSVASLQVALRCPWAHAPWLLTDVLRSATDPAVISLALARGANINGPDGEGQTPLMAHRSRAVTEQLLAAGARVAALDKLGRSALHHSNETAELAGCYEALLRAGADPSLRAPEDCNRTPLLALVTHSWSEAAARTLVSHGADPLAQDCEGRSAVIAFLRRHVDGKAGQALAWSELDFRGEVGSTLLIDAMRSEDVRSLDLLLELGATATIAGRDGVTPLAFSQTLYSGEYRARLEAPR